MSTASLANLAVPAGLSLHPGGYRYQDLPFSAPPQTDLASRHPGEVIDLLRYAGVRYRSPDCPAAAFGVRVFEAGRELGRSGPHGVVTFDWDHTLSNYQIFTNLVKLLGVRASKERPPEDIGALPMVAVETARPFMQEFAFGTMAGFALRQGLKSLDQWENYVPQVGVATHTWPDRLGLLAAHYMPLLPLMEGMLPGSSGVYEKFAHNDARSVIHLHHFLSYAEALTRTYETKGFGLFTAVERDEMLTYLEDGKAHHRKPIGAWAMRGLDISTLMHVDDSTKVVKDLMRQGAIGKLGGVRAFHVPHPHSNVFPNVQEWHKISLPSLWRGRNDALHGVIRHLAHVEWRGSTIAPLLGALGVFDEEETGWPSKGLPEGTVMTTHETPTTLGEFWEFYVNPTNRGSAQIRRVRKKNGGIRTIRRDYEAFSTGP
ncbi:MAG TPA: hypothetical protein VFX30_06410 [bacterium]|nr:hypothetical protein [bacterium]